MSNHEHFNVYSSPKTTHRPDTHVIKDDWLWLVILIEIFVFFVCVSIFMLYLNRKKKVSLFYIRERFLCYLVLIKSVTIFLQILNRIVCRQGHDKESEIQSGEKTSDKCE